MVKTISKKISVKASSSKPLGVPPPGDKTLGIEPATLFYSIEDGYDTKEGEEAETLVIHDSRLAASNQNLVKRKFPYIDAFDHEGPAVVSAMRDLTVEVFEHLETISPMDVNQRVAYTQIILKGDALKKYREVMV